MEITVPSLLRIKPDAINKIGKYLRGEKFDNVALFWGEGMQTMLGPKVKISFDSSEITALTEAAVSNSSVEEIFKVGIALPQKVKAIVAIGGGMAIDACKYIGFINQLPVISVPTAISNDGFASPLSALLVGGKKKTLRTAIPYGVIVDTNIIANAPVKFLYSGMGDLFCKNTAIFDWKLAYHKMGLAVNDFASTIAKNACDTFVYYQNRDLKNSEYIRIIASSLLMSGIAMEIAQSSRPASGSEHLISHAYDKLAKKPSMHGLQVGVATYAVSYLQETTYETTAKIIKDCGFLDFLSQNKLSKADFIEAVKYAPNIKEDFYSILSEKGSIERLVEFVEKDSLINQMME